MDFSAKIEELKKARAEKLAQAELEATARAAALNKLIEEELEKTRKQEADYDQKRVEKALEIILTQLEQKGSARVRLFSPSKAVLEQIYKVCSDHKLSIEMYSRPVYYSWYTRCSSDVDIEVSF